MNKRKYVYLAILTVIIALFVVFLALRGNGVASEKIIVKRGDIVQQISVTGSTKPSESINLAFEKMGKITVINVKVGERVVIGQSLALLDLKDDSVKKSQAWAGVQINTGLLEQYQAALEVQEAKLRELKQGTRPEEISIAQTQVENAKTSVKDAEISYTNTVETYKAALSKVYESSIDVINDAYLKAEDAITKQADELYFNGSGSNPAINFQTSDSQAETDTKALRLEMSTILSAWKNDNSKLNFTPTHDDIDTVLSSAQNYLYRVRIFLARLMDALNASSQSLTTQKTSIYNARTNINTSLTNIENQIQSVITQKIAVQTNTASSQAKINDAKNALLNAENQLNLKISGATPEAIIAQEAQVKQALANIVSQEAQVEKARADVLASQVQYEKNLMRSPINGIITKQDGKIGQIANASAPIITVMSESNLEIEANIPEVDISDVALNSNVAITFDAFPNEIYHGKVSHIDPAETIIDGVVNYKIKVALDIPNEKIKSGLTANLLIEAARKENVLIIPQVAIIEKDEGFFVKKITAGKVVEMPVILGIKGSDSNNEILSGIEENDIVLNVALKK